MPPSLANGLLLAVAAYAVAGVLFAIPFYLRWLKELDPDAREGSLGFRLLIFPGVLALWPLLLLRVRAGGPKERSPHRDSALSSASDQAWSPEPAQEGGPR